MIDDDKWVSFHDIECNRATDKAILVDILGEEQWIPKSAISDDSEVYKSGTSGTLIISAWIAKTKGLV